MILDATTEAISHFAGLFHIALEEARLRHAFREFDEARTEDRDFDPIEAIPLRVSANYELLGYVPHLQYQPFGWTIEKIFSQTRNLEPIVVKVRPVDHERLEARLDADLQRVFPERLQTSVAMTIDPPGSVIDIVFQNIHLADNDILSVGDHGLSLRGAFDQLPRLGDITRDAQALSPLADLRIKAGSVDELIALIEEADARLRDYVPGDGEETRTFVLKADVIDGIYVNGVLVDDAPDFDLYRPLPVEEAEPVDESAQSFRSGGRSGNEAGDPGTVAQGQSLHSNGLVLETSVEITAGDNLLLNSVRLSNEWLAGPVFAVGLDHIELNAVIQINAWQDIDHLGSAVANWRIDTDDPTLGFNIAEFKRIDPRVDGPSDAASPSGFPKAWAVAELTGDLVILNWIEQFSFMLDHDIAVLSAFGSKVMALLGGNTMGNAASVQEIGLYYDLIFVGGSIYDVNLIQQMNVLLDNDLVAGVSGFGTSGAGSVESAGNLLWNQANIVQVGAADRFAAMPEAYRQALDGLKSGKTDMPDDVLKDPAFAGLQGLRVLHITGDILNLQYVKQTNILGDSDQVIMARNALEAQSNASWTVTTGANTLVNVASVGDVDGTGKTYVGGERYSDEILIQANFMPRDPWLAARDPSALVSEAVVFLGDGMLGGNSDTFHHAPYGAPPIHAPHPDVMHTMLA